MAEGASRRGLLARAALGLSAAALASGADAAALAATTDAPAPSLPADPDPHVAWGREARRLDAWLDADETEFTPEPEKAAAFEALCALERAICSTPARTIAGVREQLFQVAYLTAHFEPDETTEAALANAIATLDRLLSPPTAEGATA